MLPVQSAQAATSSKAGANTKAPKTSKATAVRKAKPAPRSPRKVAARAAAREVAVVPPKPSFGQMYGLHDTEDPLDLKSSVALVLDQDTNEVLFSKNPQAVLPIASITKLMTALLVVEAKQDLEEKITITDDDKDTEKFTSSRLAVGTTLTRGELLHLALMSSENRAAHALGRNYPGGLETFVAAMNTKAQLLGMGDTHYVEPTGLSSRNQSSARDLAVLVKTAHQFPLIRELSTSPEYTVALGRRLVRFGTTNGLVRKSDWDIGLQKTGFINEVVAQADLCVRMVKVQGQGKGPIDAFVEGLNRVLQTQVRVLDYHEHALGSGADAQAVAYLELRVGEHTLFGVGMDGNIASASLKAIVSGLRRAAQRGQLKLVRLQAA